MLMKEYWVICDRCGATPPVEDFSPDSRGEARRAAADYGFVRAELADSLGAEDLCHACAVAAGVA